MICPKAIPEDCCEHDHSHDARPRDHDEHAHTLADKSAKQLSWVGTALGLTLHSLLDGLALAAAVAAGTQGHAKLAGLGVALVVILHKPFDAMAVSTLMAASGKSHFSRHVLNGLFALASPVGRGAVLFWSQPLCRRRAGARLCAGVLRRLVSLHRQQPTYCRNCNSIRTTASNCPARCSPGLAVAIIIKHFEVG